MSAYKLYYFDMEGRAEPIRMIFIHAGVEFEDVRIPFADWPTQKQNMPYRHMPVLEVDGEKISQSLAIVRYLAGEFGLTGKDALTQARADEFSEACNDIMKKLPTDEKDEDKKDELMQIALDEKIPPLLALIEANMDGEFYAGELTYGDFLFAYGIGYLMEFRPDLLDATPKLKSLRRKVFELPNIAKYIASKNGAAKSS